MLHCGNANYLPNCDIGCALRQWSLCRFRPLSKYSFEPIQCCLPSSGADMRRREFIMLVGGAAASWPLAAPAQQLAMPLVGFINGGSPEGYAPMVAAFHSGLNERG